MWPDIEGGYLYTLTLTDVATGWTECLALLYRSQETVLTALQQARLLFPFPILGIDTDNGGEFINEAVIAYCAQAHITFTRGRPYLKNDQCFVEQKSGDIFRELQRRSPGRYQPLQIRTLQRGMRKIRVSLLDAREEQWQEEVISGSSPSPVTAGCSIGNLLTAAN